MNRWRGILCSALAAFSLASPTILNVCAQNVGKSDPDAKALDRARRTVEVKEEVSDAGISSGLVVAYGHPLHQPYHFEYRGNALLVNGIQVEPTLVMQRDADKTRHDMTADDAQYFSQLQDLTRKARAAYFNKHGKLSDDRLRAEVLWLVQTHPLVKESRWLNDVEIIYTGKKDKYPFGNGISFSPPSARANVKPPPQEKLQRYQIDWYESDLKAGKCVFFGAIGAWNGSLADCQNIRQSVRRIMQQPSLSQDDKEKELRAAFRGDPDIPRDILANYKSEEWK